MNLDEIKKLIEEDKGKIIIVENGEPTMVVISFDEYRKKKIGPEKKKAAPMLGELTEEELKIEDLPF